VPTCSCASRGCRPSWTRWKARLALVEAGYEADDDGLWRLSDSAEAVDRSQVLMKIEEQFQKDIDQV
jgi:hypothetical protein